METTNQQHRRKNRSRPRGGPDGFSLVEVVIVIVLVALVAAIAIPLMSDALPKKALKGAARDLYSAMMRAKAEAARLGAPVAVQMNPDGRHFFRIFADNGDGDGGDGKPAAGNGKFEKDLGEALIVEGSPLPSRVIFLQQGKGKELGFGYVVNDDGGHPDAARTALLFDRRGLPYMPNGTTPMNGSVTLCLAKSTENQYGVGDDSVVKDKNACQVIKVNKAGRVLLVPWERRND